MAFAEDLTAFTADFGVTATIGAATVRGIFDETSGMAFGMMEGGKPTFTCRSADIPAVARNTTLSIGGVAYLVAEPPRPDGTGMTVLTLELNQ